MMSGRSGDRVPGPTKLPGWVAGPMSSLYGWEAGRRANRFDAGVGVERIDRPVISVGNLSAGGTGKSPVVRWIVRLLQEHGHHPAIAMRGYKAKPGEMSDEQAEHAAELPGVPIVAQPDRIAGLRALFGTEEGASVDCVVLDDGFQHRRLARDLDIVLIDATRPAHRDALLPAGFLREPVSALSRADAVVFTRSELVDPDELEASARAVGLSVSGDTPVFAGAEHWESVREITCSDEIVGKPESVDGQTLAVCCAIGNPGAFLRSAERAGVSVGERFLLRDHAEYDRAIVERIARAGSSCDGVLTTGKDWVKIAGLWSVLGVSGVLPKVFVPALGICFHKQLRGADGSASVDRPILVPESGVANPQAGDASETFAAMVLGAVPSKS